MNDIHDLRTRARRVEAIAGILIPANENSRRRLLKLLKPLRKAAGDVRDMDVLAAKARTLAGRQQDNSVVCLLEHLQAIRIESARKLVNTVNKQRADTRDGLKQFSRWIEKHIHTRESGSASKTTARKSYTDAAIRLMDELSRWPAFSKDNLHPFRIEVKHLRYVLLLTETADLKFVNALEKAKSRIGDWHDWQELRDIALEVLDPKKNRPMLQEIDEIVGKKLKQALAAAHSVKTRYLGAYRGFTVVEP